MLLLGRATRLLPYLDAEPKIYDATIRFGAETTTDDVTGDVVRRCAPPTRQAVEAAIPALTGTIEQEPPAFSAKKVQGRRAYEAARRGEAVALAPVPVTVHRWEIRAWREADVDVTVTCAGGTYVRALARDLGRLAGSAAHLVALRRTASGPFSVRDALPIDALRAAASAPRPPLAAVPSLPIVHLSPDEERRVRLGQRIDAVLDAPRAALVSGTGELVAIAERERDAWQPRLVLPDA